MNCSEGFLLSTCHIIIYIYFICFANNKNIISSHGLFAEQCPHVFCMKCVQKVKQDYGNSCFTSGWNGASSKVNFLFVSRFCIITSFS